MADLVNVNVKIGGTTQSIKMEKGVTFENKGGIYTVDDNGQLKKFDKKANVWTDASKIEMTNYQWKAFQNVANNDGSSKTYTKADIEKAQELYRKGGFKADMSQDLPSGYKIEKPKLDSKQDYVQVDVTNGKPTQSATLKFQIQEIEELKAASQARESQTPANSNSSTSSSRLSNDFNVPTSQKTYVEFKNYGDRLEAKVTDFYNAEGFIVQRKLDYGSPYGTETILYEYKNGKISQEKSTDGTIIGTYSYSSSGVTYTGRAGDKYIYDKNNRLVKVDYKENSPYLQDIVYNYDANGRLTRESQGVANIEYVYSGNSQRPTQIKCSNELKTYDADVEDPYASPRKLRTLSSNYNNIKYDASGKLVSVTETTNCYFVGEDGWFVSDAYEIIEHKRDKYDSSFYISTVGTWKQEEIFHPNSRMRDVRFDSSKPLPYGMHARI